MTSANVPEHAEVPPPKLEEVSPGIFGYVQLDGSWGLNNTGFMVGKDGVVVFDTCFTEKRSRLFYDAVRKTAGDKAIRTLVNTHHHGDHTHGNYVFLPAATIIGHDLCRQEVIAAGHSTKGMFPGVEWGEIEIAPPFVTFDERLSLYVDDLRVELIFMGPAHTTNDIVAWIPERKVLFAGDIVLQGGTPFVMMGSVAGSLEALERLKALVGAAESAAFPAEAGKPRLRSEAGGSRVTIVPGHGPVCGSEVIDEVADYLRMVQEAAKKGLDAGLGPGDGLSDGPGPVRRVAGQGAAGGEPAPGVQRDAGRAVGGAAEPRRRRAGDGAVQRGADAALPGVTGNRQTEMGNLRD